MAPWTKRTELGINGQSVFAPFFPELLAWECGHNIILNCSKPEEAHRCNEKRMETGEQRAERFVREEHRGIDVDRAFCLFHFAIRL
jgi:hypothetical protein